MREIIFRGKRTDNGEWIQGDLRHITDLHGGYYPCIVDNSNGRNNYASGVSIIPSTLGECTGLTDKNGTTIFEGDIIKYFPVREDFEEKGVIRWDKIRAGFIIRLLDGAEDGFCKVTSTLHRCEVIGNVHDNPELL